MLVLAFAVICNLKCISEKLCLNLFVAYLVAQQMRRDVHVREVDSVSVPEMVIFKIIVPFLFTRLMILQMILRKAKRPSREGRLLVNGCFISRHLGLYFELIGVRLAYSAQFSGLQRPKTLAITVFLA